MGEKQAMFTERDLVAHVASLYPEGATSQELTQATRRLLRAAEGSGQVVTVLPNQVSTLGLPEGVVLSTEELTGVADRLQGWVDQGDTVRFRALPGETRYTTRLQLEREATVLAAVANDRPIHVDRSVLDAAIIQRLEEQAKAMRHLANWDGCVAAVVGPGGSGKTYGRRLRASLALEAQGIVGG